MVKLNITSCCGLVLLSNVYDGTTVAELKDAKISARSIRKGMMIATINSEERQYGAGKTLVRAGFKLVKRFNNPSSGNRVYVYYKLTYKEQKQKPKARVAKRSKRGRTSLRRRS